jgi:hypothetical protein
MIKLTATQDIKPSNGCIRTRSGELMRVVGVRVEGQAEVVEVRV